MRCTSGILCRGNSGVCPTNPTSWYGNRRKNGFVWKEPMSRSFPVRRGIPWSASGRSGYGKHQPQTESKASSPALSTARTAVLRCGTKSTDLRPETAERSGTAISFAAAMPRVENQRVPFTASVKTLFMSLSSLIYGRKRSVWNTTAKVCWHKLSGSKIRNSTTA